MRNANQSFDRALGTLEQWARERGISANGTVEGQANKTIEKAGEVIDALKLIEKSAFLTDQGQHEDAEALAEIGYKDLKKALGDTGVSWIMCCHCANRDPVEMLYKAIDEIRDCRGHMGEDGTFHKEPETSNNTSAGGTGTRRKTPPPLDPDRFGPRGDRSSPELSTVQLWFAGIAILAASAFGLGVLVSSIWAS